ncbi:MAG: hypothetical protein U0R77_12845 [Mycolicibacterium insubricum]|nr:hypothetical protein [Mycobacterium sp.]
MAAPLRAARWAIRLLGTAALIGAVVVMMYPVAVPSGAHAATTIPCGSVLSRNISGTGDYARACTAAVVDQRTLALALAAVGVVILLSRAKWVLLPAIRAPKGEPGRPDWVSA